MAKSRGFAITHNLGEQKTQPANLLKHQCFLGLEEACEYEPNMYMCVFSMIVHKDSKIGVLIEVFGAGILLALKRLI